MSTDADETIVGGHINKISGRSLASKKAILWGYTKIRRWPNRQYYYVTDRKL